MSFFCAVPPALPSDPEGVGAFPAAGPYYVAEYRVGERIVIKRNRFYGGRRPHHVDGFEVDLRPRSPGELLDRVESGEIDWTYAAAPIYLDSSRGLIAKYGLDRSQFFVRPGLTLRLLVLNSSRALFKDNPQLRRAVNLAIDRLALSRTPRPRKAAGGSPISICRPSCPDTEPHRSTHSPSPTFEERWSLRGGNERGGKAVFYVPNFPPPLALAQLVKRQLAEIGLDVELRPVPYHVTSAAYLGPLFAAGRARGTSRSCCGRPTTSIHTRTSTGCSTPALSAGSNLARFDSPTVNRLLRQAARLEGSMRYRRYGELDVELARDEAPLVPIEFFDEPTLVSKRVGCVVLRPTLDLTAACLKP